MSGASAQDVLIGLLPDDDVLKYLSRERIDLRIVPTESLRDVITWALRYYEQGGKSPSVNAIKEQWGTLLADEEIDIDEEPEETIEWALEQLRANYIRFRVAAFTKSLAEDITLASPEEKVPVLQEKAAELAALVQTVETRRNRVELAADARDLWEEYQEVKNSGGEPQGLLLGIREIDDYTHGIHFGELAGVSAPAKVGKSWKLDFIAWKNYQAGHAVALFTLENSISMTRQRIACFALGISIERMQRGELDEDEEEMLREWIFEKLERTDNGLYILSPDEPQRTPQAIVQQTRALGVRRLCIDQFSHMKTGTIRRNNSRTGEASDIVHDLRTAISTGRTPLACALAVQVNREGIQAAKRSGKFDMEHMADTSGVERAPDWLFGMNAPGDLLDAQRMNFYTLAARRVKPKNFQLIWQIDVGRIAFGRELDT